VEQSLIAAVSGIDTNQDWLDIIGNNIANSNTVGYKSEDAVFTDLLADQISGASAPSSGNQSAGENPTAIGSGVQLSAVTNDQTQGSLQQTNQPTDVAIQGNGFFVVEQDGIQEYTRAGSLSLDGNGNLATPTGGLIQGWQANDTGAIDTNAPTTGVTIPIGETIEPNATTAITLGGNLPAWSGTGSQNPITTTITAYDSLGNQIPVSLTFTPVAATPNEWTLSGTVPDGSSTSNLFSTASPPIVTFDPASGQISSVTGATTNSDGSLSLPVTTMPPANSFPATDTWNIDFPAPGSIGDVTQFAGEQTIAAVKADGNASGTLETFSIGADGVITGSFSNGETESIGQLALASFSNPGGLSDQGNLMYTSTPNSGNPEVGTPESGGRGSLVGGSLEGSNVDLATQLTDLIAAQESYQANSKVISTTDQALQSLENLG
jgi:flagellar hook protein FlgE